MKHRKIVNLLLATVFCGIIAGSILNTVVISMNGGMPIIGYTSSIERWVPMSEETKLGILADIIHIGNYVMSLGDLFIFTGAAACAILLWMVLPDSRILLPLLAINVIGAILSRAVPDNFLPAVLFSIAAVCCALAIYLKGRRQT